MLDTLPPIVKISGLALGALLAVLVIGLLYYRFVTIPGKLNFYRKQGAMISPGSETLMGNVDIFMKHKEYVQTTKESPKHMWTWILDEAAKAHGMEKLDAAKTPIVVVHMLGSVQLVVSDPAFARDFFTT